MYQGVGASRVRDVFQKAKQNAPCIVFIDELDAVGKQRQGVDVTNPSSEEKDSTINQMLTEMDGYSQNEGIVVLAATNLPDVIDKALTRPGRFNRKIMVGLPDLKARINILNVHVKDKKLAEDLDLKNVAKLCIGMSGADLANVMNEAAILAVRAEKTEIDFEVVQSAIEKIQIGLEKKDKKFSEKRQNLVSYHEAGHALIGALMDQFDTVSKISI